MKFKSTIREYLFIGVLALCFTTVTGIIHTSLLSASVKTTSISKIEKQIDKFIATKEKYLKSSQEDLLKEILKVENKVKRSQLDPDEKILILEKIQSDYDQCESTGLLPKSNVLIDVALKFAEKRQGVLESIEKKRKSLVEKSIKIENNAIYDKLNELNERVAELLGNRVEFQSGDNWAGYGITKNGGGFKVKLHVNNVSGSKIIGHLTVLRANGKKILIKCQGDRLGNKISIATTQVTKGKGQKYYINGYVLGTRLVAVVKGKKITGKKKVQTVITSNGIKRAKRKKNVKRGGEKKVKVKVPKVKLIDARISLTKRK